MNECIKTCEIRINLSLHPGDDRTGTCHFGQPSPQATPRRSRLAEKDEAHRRNDGIESGSAV
jgi:hypothetical protein